MAKMAGRERAYGNKTPSEDQHIQTLRHTSCQQPLHNKVTLQQTSKIISSIRSLLGSYRNKIENIMEEVIRKNSFFEEVHSTFRSNVVKIR